MYNSQNLPLVTYQPPTAKPSVDATALLTRTVLANFERMLDNASIQENNYQIWRYQHDQRNIDQLFRSLEG